jgi:predicted TIM-barrel fold metal-dependent hydrolase
LSSIAAGGSAPKTLVYKAYRQDWLDRRREEVLEPDLPIVDAHHHLYERPRPRYMLEELLADTSAGHNIVATVCMESSSMYRAAGPEHLKTVGETEFVNGVAAMAASGAYGPARLCAAIVGRVLLNTDTGLLRETLEGHIRAGNGRFRGVRQVAFWDEDPNVQPPNPERIPHLLARPDFRAGFALLEPLGLSFDVWVGFAQLDEAIALARDFPGTSMVMNHVGGPISIGRYAGRRDEVFTQWRSYMETLSRCPNVTMKLGGMGMRLFGFALDDQPDPPSSEQLAELWRPYMDTLIQLFGPKRCMFESNFPVDKGAFSYPVVWNAFKRIASGYSTEEKGRLFAGTAIDVYRIDLPSCD